MDFSEVTGGLRLVKPPARRGKIYPTLADSSMDRLLKKPTREPWPPARGAYSPEGTEEKSTLFRKI
ncbi:MAG: hypothetical protein R6T98_03890 [Desulfatiglandales bacterium]